MKLRNTTIFSALLASWLLSPQIARAQTDPESSAPPSTYGTSSVVYVYYPAAAFSLYDTTGTHFYKGDGNGHRYADGNSVVDAPVQVPSGALLVDLRLDYCDTNAVSHVGANLWICSNIAAGDTCSSGNLTLNSDNGPSGCNSVNGSLTGFNTTVDNSANSYFIRVSTQGGDNTTTFGGVRLGYMLQVSPAPAVASFVDVPTSSPIFKFVEALKASGITAGCDATHYCPNASLTRGQMAVFLAAALGLHWPN